MSVTPLTADPMTPAEYHWLRPREAAHAVFQAVRYLDRPEMIELLAAARLPRDELARYQWQFERLAREFDNAHLFIQLTDQVRGAAISARGFDWGAQDNGYRGPGYAAWSEFADRASLHTASLVIDPWLLEEIKDLTRVPGLPVELI